jgi:hypothetical protein
MPSVPQTSSGEDCGWKGRSMAIRPRSSTAPLEPRRDIARQAHTPEVPEERRAAAATGVQRRYRKYRNAVAGSVEKTESAGEKA